MSKEKKAQLLDKLEQSLAEIETPDHMKVICKNSTEKLEREQKLQVLGLLHEFSDIFAKNPKDIGKTTNYSRCADRKCETGLSSCEETIARGISSYERDCRRSVPVWNYSTE